MGSLLLYGSEPSRWGHPCGSSLRVCIRSRLERRLYLNLNPRSFAMGSPFGLSVVLGPHSIGTKDLLGFITSPFSMANISTNRSAISCGKHCFSLWNCRGLKPLTVPSKVPFIQDLLRVENQLFIALTETWLNEHKNAELLINGYTISPRSKEREMPKRKGQWRSGCLHEKRHSSRHGDSN